MNIYSGVVDCLTFAVNPPVNDEACPKITYPVLLGYSFSSKNKSK